MMVMMKMRIYIYNIHVYCRLHYDHHTFHLFQLSNSNGQSFPSKLGDLSKNVSLAISNQPISSAINNQPISYQQLTQNQQSAINLESASLVFPEARIRKGFLIKTYPNLNHNLPHWLQSIKFTITSFGRLGCEH